jgi:4-amino-4-deoxy-L-arabinose transferase-like glycosyltransferase
MQSAPRVEPLVLIALTVLALLLRLTSLSRSLFTDEAYSLALAQRSFGHMLALFGYEANGTPYSIVLWPLIRIFGTGVTLLRLPSVIAGTLSVPALWWAARRFTAPAAALLAAGLLAINPMAVWYSQEARAYGFVMLSACLAFGALPRALERGGERRAWIGYVAAMTVLAYCEIFAAPLALPAQALIVWRAGRAGLRRWLYSLLAVFVCCLPLLVAAAIARSRRNALYWLPKTDRSLVTLALQEFTAGFSGLTAVRWVTLAAAVVLVGAALWLMRAGRAAALRGTLAMALCWGLAPAAVLLVISFVEPVFWPRYAILSLPGLCLALAVGAERLWHSRHGIATGAVCVAVLAAAAGVADAHQRSYHQEEWPPAAAWLRKERAAGQPTIVDNALVLPSLGYYDPAFRAPGGDLIVQEWRDEPLPSGFVGFKDRTSYGSVPNGPPSAATFARLAQLGHGTVWMVVSEVDDELQENPREGAAVAWARKHCRGDVREYVGVWILHAFDCGASGPR